MNKYYLGGDVSKGYCDFILLDAQMNIKHKLFRLDDTPSGHNSLLNILKKKVLCEDYIIYSAVESTGGYEDHWYNAISKFSPELNIKIARINPSRIHEIDKVLNDKTKTDKISAVGVAKYLIRFNDKVDYERIDLWKDIKRQWSFFRLLNTQKIQLSSHLESLIYKYNPGLIQYLNRGLSNWLLELLIKYPTPQKIKNSKVIGLTKIKYITEKRANEIKSKVVGYFVDTPQEIGGIVSIICKQIKLKNELIQNQLLIVEQQIPSKEVDILISFKGIDKLSAIGLLVEIGEVKRFESREQIVRFFGVFPTSRRSGDKFGNGRMSRSGRPEVKRLLYMISLSAIRYNNDIRHFYLRKKLEGKPSMVALGACMHKILKIVYSMLKNKQKFNPSYTSENLKKLESRYEELVKNKTIQKLQEKYQQENPNNRFQENAPISSQEKKLRRKYKEYYNQPKK